MNVTALGIWVPLVALGLAAFGCRASYDDLLSQEDWKAILVNVRGFDAQSYRLQARAHLELGNSKEARHLLRISLELEDSASARCELGRLDSQLGLWGSAFRHMGAGLALGSDDVVCHQQFAMVSRMRKAVVENYKFRVSSAERFGIVNDRRQATETEDAYTVAHPMSPRILCPAPPSSVESVQSVEECSPVQASRILRKIRDVYIHPLCAVRDAVKLEKLGCLVEASEFWWKLLDEMPLDANWALAAVRVALKRNSLQEAKLAMNRATLGARSRRSEIEIKLSRMLFSGRHVRQAVQHAVWAVATAPAPPDHSDSVTAMRLLVQKGYAREARLAVKYRVGLSSESKRQFYRVRLERLLANMLGESVPQGE